ncbi:LmbE family protein [Mucilaginibacter hurinus]|uniref:LmbE family protein n=1 Tax=Mucilaginibacter hurinus TaxID=2201324 RepID=A0A367GLF4_9SPHI|nr:PIG-L family deacetylase [Mucilaginibacter hurinus]RCH53808.1 LmbE family protein [Mucilaginibacter hurinus]
MKLLKLALLLLLAAPYTYSQTAPPAGLADIQHHLRDLNVLGSVLYVAAHPDDENTRLLAYMAKEKHYRTGYLSLTRGDGGQNLVGNEQGELLGLIRTQELLAARRVDGAEQFFTRANDFGFSKTPEETLKIWDKEKVLGDVVWVIRKFRPDVVICRFPTTGQGGHGHHTASAILAQEAFAAAADPKRYPEQLRKVQVWQAKRLLWNTYSFGNINTTAADQFKIDVGAYSPLTGKSIGEIAAESRSNHKSQGFGSASQRGQVFEFFKTILGDAPKSDLFDDIDATWNRVNATGISLDINVIKKAFENEHPEKSVPALLKLLDKVEAIKDIYWREQKAQQLRDLIAACAGLWFESYANQATYATGEKMTITSQVISQMDSGVQLAGIGTGENIASINAPLPKNQMQVFTSTARATELTQPYWLAQQHGVGIYNFADTLAGYPENPDLPKVTFNFIIGGRSMQFRRTVLYKYTEPVRGEVYQPIEITPPVTANIEHDVYLYSTHQPQAINVKLKSFINGSGNIRFKPVPGWKITPEKIDFSNKKINDEWTVGFTVTPGSTAPGTAMLQAAVEVNGKTFSLGLHRIRYEHIPNITLYPPAQTKIINLEIKTSGKNIGYIAGAGDKVPEALRQLGYTVHLLNENEVMHGNLAAYDAIITGVRAYNVNDRLAFEQPALLEYVKNGGNLVVQYNTAGRLVSTNIGPYPFDVVNQRVTEEAARVTITDPAHPVFNFPNKITDADFDNWVQERGLYFVDNIDPKYATPLLMNDTNQAPAKGSLLVAGYGKGRFVYTSLAFFRQLPAGVPGAYRLFVNLLSEPK